MLTRKTIKRLLALVTIAALFFALAAGCSQPADNGAEKITVTVKITAPDKEIINEDIQIDKEGATAGKAIMQACQSKKLAYTNDSGLYDNFDGVASTETEGWVFLYNGETVMVGADEQEIKSGDTVEFIYGAYSDYFDF